MKMTLVTRVMVAMALVALIVAAQPRLAEAGTVSRVSAFDTESWTVWVSAGWHRVVVDGDGDTDLDLFVYNGAGRLLDSDDDNLDYCIASFYMPRGGYIAIRVHNLGTVYNEYEITVR